MSSVDAGACVCSEAVSPGGSYGLSRNSAADSSVRSVERALILLETLASASSPVHLSDLARATGMSKTTVHRLLGSLAGRQFVTRVAEHYAVGSQLFELAADAEHARRLHRLLMPFLMELLSRTHGAVTVGVLRDRHVLYSDPLYDQRNLPRMRAVAPAHSTALGKLLLAYQPGDALALEDLELERCTDKTVPNVAALFRQLTEIRRHRMAYSYEERVPGEIEVAVPVFTTHQRVVTGLSVCGTVGKLNLQTAAIHASRVARLASAYCQERAVASFLWTPSCGNGICQPERRTIANALWAVAEWSGWRVLAVVAGLRNLSTRMRRRCGVVTEWRLPSRVG
jgi:IclR family transcriptional regulator, acetate operon repressor